MWNWQPNAFFSTWQFISDSYDKLITKPFVELKGRVCRPLGL